MPIKPRQTPDAWAAHDDAQQPPPGMVGPPFPNQADTPTDSGSQRRGRVTAPRQPLAIPARPTSGCSGRRLIATTPDRASSRLIGVAAEPRDVGRRTLRHGQRQWAHLGKRYSARLDPGLTATRPTPSVTSLDASASLNDQVGEPTLAAKLVGVAPLQVRH